jgi:UrcA family protein
MSVPRLSNTLGVILSAAALVQCAVPAQASPQDLDKPQTRVVRFADLDLSTAPGVKALYVRIREAARSVCGDSESPNSPFPNPAFQACVATAIKSAVTRVNHPSLTSYYAERERRSAPLFVARNR